MIKNNTHNPDVLSCLANLSNDEVFTSPKLANDMLDLLPASLWRDPNAKFLEPAVKSGVFLREIAKRLMLGLQEEIPDEQERVNHIFKKQLFGIAITELTALLARRSIYCSKRANGKYSICDDFSNEEGNIKFDKINHTFKNGNCIFCGASQSEYEREETLETHAYQFIHTDKPEELFNMKFDVIIGNPPYQLSDGGGTGSSAMPIYQKFIQQAIRLNPRFLTMITPSRWFTGGKGLDEFRKSMLEDSRIREIHDFISASDCFPGVSIEGGVNYFLWNRDNPGLCKVATYSSDKEVSISERPLLEEGADVFIRYNQVISIIRKISLMKEKNFSEIVSSRNPYGFWDSFIESDVYDDEPDTCAVLGIDKKKRVIKDLPLRFLQRNQFELKKYRLFISKADGAAGQIGNPVPARIIGKVQIAKPNLACTETFLRIGPFNSEEEAKNAKKYMETKFFRLLVGARKNKNMTQSTYSFVPIQDWTKEWSDEKLYKKYGLNNNEMEFIESMIAEMPNVEQDDVGGNDNDK